MPKKPVSAADRTKAYKKRRTDVKLCQVKVWTTIDEAPAVRAYAASRPLTKAILKELG